MLRVTALLLLFASPALAEVRAPTEKPNVILILLDDAGYGDFEHTGHPTIATPNLTKLARGGATFTQFHAASPACTASRYSVLTGRYPSRSGLGTWVLGPKSKRHLHVKEFTLAEAFKDAGYATAMLGKWHLGPPNEANEFSPDAYPTAHGFDLWEGTNVSNDYDAAQLVRSTPDGDELLHDEIASNAEIQSTLTRRLRDGAVAFIEDHADAPFFLYLAANMPHLPVHSSEPFRGKSKAGPYGDCIEELDAMLGDVMQALVDHEIAENTIIVFTSDNGPWIRFQDAADHPKYGEARTLVGSALPFRDGKGSTWEGGVRVPGVIRWPGQIPAGLVVREMASTLDLMPTLLAMANLHPPTGRMIDGRDVGPMLTGAGDATPFEFVYTGQPDNRPYAICRGAWKLHVALSSQLGDDYGFKASRERPLLFNVEHDVGERIDRAAEQPASVAELLEALSRYEASLAKHGTFWDNAKQSQP